jgi:predicted metalloprotease
LFCGEKDCHKKINYKAARSGGVRFMKLFLMLFMVMIVTSCSSYQYDEDLLMYIEVTKLIEPSGFYNVFVEDRADKWDNAKDQEIRLEEIGKATAERFCENGQPNYYEKPELVIFNGHKKDGSGVGSTWINIKYSCN